MKIGAENPEPARLRAQHQSTRGGLADVSRPADDAPPPKWAKGAKATKKKRPQKNPKLTQNGPKTGPRVPKLVKH